jgi:hypothetical protein
MSRNVRGRNPKKLFENADTMKFVGQMLGRTKIEQPEQSRNNEGYAGKKRSDGCQSSDLKCGRTKQTDEYNERAKVFES